MPDYPIGANPLPSGTVFIGVVDAGSKTSGVSLPANATDPTDLTDALIEGVRGAIGNLSNAAVYKVERQVVEEVPIAFVTPLDEAHSSVVNRLNLNFMNIQGHEHLLSIPAPDLSYFTAGGGSLIRPDITATVGTPARILANSLTAMIAYLNIADGGDPSFRLIAAYETTRTGGKRGKPSLGRLVYAEEPETGELPAGAPDNAAAAGQQP